MTTMPMTPLAAQAKPQVDLAQQQEQLAAIAKNKQDVHKAAVKFESVYLNEMFSHMFQSVDQNNPFGGGHGEEMFKSMMVEQYGQLVANSGQTKISTSIEKEMLKMQEQQSDPHGFNAPHSKLATGAQA